MTKINKIQKGSVVIYKPKSGKSQLRVKLEHGTIWLNQKQMSDLFKIERSVITKHINNVLKTGELNKNSVCANFAHTAKDGKIYKTGFYNLDMIISVGYRVNSKQGTQFRIWATKVLSDYVIKGYALNQKRLKEQRKIRLGELQKTVALIQGVIDRRLIEQDEAQGLLKVITDYTDLWVTLARYDKKSLSIKGVKKKAKVFEYEETKDIIKQLKKKLIKKQEAGKYFGIERKQGLETILTGLSEEVAGKSLHQSIEEKAAHLLYFIIKDRVFIDGNKRIASLLFILFLDRNNCLRSKTGERRINDSALIALALLVDESKTQEKDIIVALITNILV